MIPGGRGLSQKQLKMLMKKQGISLDEIEDVEEIVIKTSTKNYVFKNASVTCMNVQGQETYQIVGTPEIVEGEGEKVIPEEDIQLVASQAGVSEEEAKKALEECNGEPAEAIIKLMGQKG